MLSVIASVALLTACGSQSIESAVAENPEVISAMKQEIIKSIKYNSDPSVKDLVRMCKKDNYNIVYRYVGSSSYAIVDVCISPSEM